MTRLLVAVAVLALSSSIQASSIDDPTGPGAWTPQPELQQWYNNWMVLQPNGRYYRAYTPANEKQCRAELLQVETAYPPVVTIIPGSEPEFLRRRVTYHPAYREARMLRRWLWSYPAAN